MAKRVNPTPADAASAATPSMWKDTLASTVSNAMSEAAAEASADEPADDAGEPDPAPEAEGEPDGNPEGEYASGEDDGQDDGADPAEWDGNPDTIPDTLKPVFEKAIGAALAKREGEMSRGVQKVLKQLQDERQAVQQQAFQLQQMQIQMQKAQAPRDLGPQEPGEDASREQWQRYYDDRAAWVARQTFEQQMAQMRQAGAIPDPNQFAAMRAQQQQIEIMNHLTTLPGMTQEVATRMNEIVTGDRIMGQVLASGRDGAETVFNLAKRQVEAEAAAKAAADKSVDAAKRGQGARNNAVPRMGGVRNDAPLAPLPKDGKLRNTREKIAFVMDQQRRSAG